MEVMPGLQTLNSTINQSQPQYAYQYFVSNENPSYTDYKPMDRELIPLSKATIYLLMAAVVVVGAAYAIVGHLMKDLAHDIADCILGPQTDGKNHKVHELKSTNISLLSLSEDKMNVYCLPSQPEVCVMISATETQHLPTSCDGDSGQRKVSLQCPG